MSCGCATAGPGRHPAGPARLGDRPLRRAPAGGGRDHRADRVRGPGRLQGPGQLANDPIGLPNPWVTAELHRTRSASPSFWRQLANSTIIAALSTVLVVLFAALAAFVFARRTFPGREVLYTLFTLGLLFPAAVAILPLFILVRDLGLLDNPLGIALPQAAFGLPLTIVILRPFFRSIPIELEDAASIDGCGSFGFFWRILLPLSRPALATVGGAGHRASWNQFLLPLVMLSDESNWTLPLGVTNFSTQYTTDTARILAYTTLALDPGAASSTSSPSASWSAA